MVLSGRHGDVNGTVSSGGSRGLFWWKDVQSTFKQIVMGWKVNLKITYLDQLGMDEIFCMEGDLGRMEGFCRIGLVGCLE